MKNITQGVRVWEQDIVIPTYAAGAPDKNPIFLEKRVYQGSSGRVYPHSVIDKISDQREGKIYRGLFLENRYLFVMILPQLGGRIQRALDKTNQYDFVYYNHVIKPALVGLAGPWISGGIEFNWPQHHRPSTFDPVNYAFCENKDGSCTVTVSEIENMFRTKGMTGFTLYPDKAYIEVKTQLYNRTDQPQTFLWWANPAVPANEYTQSVFPPDVHAVMDHGKRDVSTFPIATGTYYKVDYSAGVDISWYKNIPVPTSYMAYHSEYDFVGGYDHRREAGILHVADHHISPGKKQWTWGCGDFGKAWERNLTDDDGPYIELMTGCFTDNQPDFSWLAPYEEKTFTQYFMPYKKIGMVKNATVDAAVNLELTGGVLRAAVYVTGNQPDARVLVRAGKRVCFDGGVALSPETAFDRAFDVGGGIVASECSVSVAGADGRVLAAYTPGEKTLEEPPEPAKAPPAPEEALTTEDLLLYGLHLEQYRHATYEPADYYREGLRRDPTDIRLNNAYGSLLLRRGRFDQARRLFERAIEKSTRSNPNPYDGEAFFNLGLCLRLLGEPELAYDAFYKATWNGPWQGAAFYQLACLEGIRGAYDAALEHVERSLVNNAHHMKARTVKGQLLRRLGRIEQARVFARESLVIDPMDFAAAYELAGQDEQGRGRLFAREGNNHNTFIEIALEYAAAGFYDRAVDLLDSYAKMQQDERAVYPLIFYYMGYYYGKMNRPAQAAACFARGEAARGDYCFPHRLEDIVVLEEALRRNPRDAKASYYLGNLWYDKRRYDKAVSCWKRSCALEPDFPTAHRNLALALYNRQNDARGAKREMEAAFACNPGDARVLMELDQLHKKTGVKPEERLNLLERHGALVKERDDLYLEYAALKNLTGDYQGALALIDGRVFHPWEGGEGTVPAQYVLCRTELARRAVEEGDFPRAEALLEQALVYPPNLGEGKLPGTQDNILYYWLGRAYEGMGREAQAIACFEKASQGMTEPASMMYYNDQPPETIFYQGLALARLKKEDQARDRFHKLIAYGEKHLSDRVKIDYFAVSLPDLQIFDEDLDKKNRVHCLYMMALGHMGLGEHETARQQLDRALELDVNHSGIRVHLALQKQLAAEA